MNAVDATCKICGTNIRVMPMAQRLCHLCRERQEEQRRHMEQQLKELLG